MNYYRNPTGEVYGYDPETQQDLIDAAIEAGWTDITGNWPPAPTDDQLKEICKSEAKQRLQDTDFSQVSDVAEILTNKAAFDAYRATVRGLFFAPVVSPVWPDRPVAVWA